MKLGRYGLIAKSTITLAFFAVILLPFGALQAELRQEVRVGVVSITKILSQAPQAQRANQRLEREFAPRERKLISSQKSLRRMEEQLAKDGATMSESQRRRVERKIISERRDLKRSMDEFREDINLRRNEELGKFQKEVLKTIDFLAKKGDFDLIINEASVIYANNNVDLTPVVLRYLKRGN